MERYPTLEGLAIPIQRLGYEVVSLEVPRTQGHHLYFERDWYSTEPVRHIFRNLLGHVARMYPVDHSDLHNRFRPPVMPRDYQMIEVIDAFAEEHNAVVCHREKKLRETYEISPDRWEQIKRSTR